MNKHMILALGALVLTAGGAQAADLQMSQSAPYVAPVSSSYDWTGFYLGANGGYGSSTVNFSTSTPFTASDAFNASGWLLGVTAGYNLAVGSNFVLGVEGDIDWTNISGTGHALDSSSTPAVANFNINTLSTLRARAGFAADNFLIYGTGGLAYATVNGGATDVETPGDNRSANGSQTGWTVGAGVEAAVSDNISIKAEYLYVDLGSQNYTLQPGTGGTNAVTASVHPTANIVRAGVNFKF